LISEYEKHGSLNFEGLVKDNLIKVQHDKETQQITPVISKTILDEYHVKTIQIGQHDNKKIMNGLGRRISVSTFGVGFIIEGAIFDEKEMNGFGRFIRCSSHNNGA